MSPTIVDLTCPGCGSPLSQKEENCKYCGRPIIISNFKTLIDLDDKQLNRYQTEYRKMLSREPDDPSVNKALGLTLMKLGLYPQSIAVFDKAESIAVFDPDIPFFFRCG